MDIIKVTKNCLKLSKSELKKLAILSRDENFDNTDRLKMLADEFVVLYPQWTLTLTDDFVEIQTEKGVYKTSNLFKLLDYALKTEQHFNNVEKGKGQFYKPMFHADETKYVKYE